MKLKIFLIFVFLFILLNLIYRPNLMEKHSFSRAIFDRNGKLLRLTLNDSDKYRLFTPFENIPQDLKNSVIFYEDQYFYYHPGFNPFSLVRAFLSLFGGRKLGASTITMQVIRMNNNLNTRTIAGKMKQIILAMQLELFYSKDKILEAYLNMAPYGHNIEGVGAASLIYFNRELKYLSLSEILALTVIPQNPTKRVPTTREGFENMISMRDALVKKCCDKLLPIQISKNLPSEAMHLVQDMLSNYDDSIINTTIDLNLQRQIENQLKSYILKNKKYGVSNGAILLVDSDTMEVLTYIGSNDFFDDKIEGQVNGVKALRSPGSVLKPFIYGLALDQGLIHSKTMLRDMPKSFGVYNPENSDRKFMGMVPADLALAYSRNVPAIDLLKQLEAGSFYNLLIKSGVNLKSEDYYGLALALGGYEISMEEIVKLYASLLNKGNLQDLIKTKNKTKNYETRILSPESSFITVKMLEKNPPVRSFSEYVTLKNNSITIPWKTGTSFGYKDAWAVGLVGPYVLAVWIGNFDGEGNNAFIGREMAGSLFFSIAENLEKTDEKVKKYRQYPIGMNIKEVEVCSDTGDIKTNICPRGEMSWFIPMVSPIKSSNIYRKIPIDIVTGKRACHSNPPFTRDEVFEFWPSDLENARKSAGLFLKAPPEFLENCDMNTRYMAGKPPEIISPMENLTYYIQGEKKLPLRVAVDSNVHKVFWFRNDKLIGEAKPDEVLFMDMEIGKWNITTIDDSGNSKTVSIIIDIIK